MSDPHGSGPRDGGGTAGLGAVASGATGTAAALFTVVSVSCCLPVAAPIVLGVLGGSAAVWSARLAPFTPWVLAVSFIALAGGFRVVYGARRACSREGGAGAPRALPRIARMVLWAGAALWVGSLVLRLSVG